MFHFLLAIIYLSFISLGLPDAVLGSAWPTMYLDFNVPVSYAGGVSMIIALGTILSSLMSDRLTYHLGTGKVTAVSVAMTAFALLGFSACRSFPMLCLMAIPYGLGAGSVDASLNNYVALHYSSRHMSWLHCMWGLGASSGPYIMGYVLTGGRHWSNGYRFIGILQILLTAVLFFSLPMWKGRVRSADSETNEAKPLPLREVIRIKGAKEVMITFFCYCAVEQTTGLWASSYLALYKGVPNESAAFFGGFFFIGITVGRGINGFLTMKLSDTQLIRLGQAIVALGIAVMLLPLGQTVSLIGLVLAGMGCAPIYPCVIHSTPAHFGAERSQALIGVQMASAYVGTCLMPPLFGLIANHISLALLPFYLAALLLTMVIMYQRLVSRTSPSAS